MAGRFAARGGYGQLNLEKPPREWDTGGLSSRNQWNPIDEGIYGAKEGSEGPKPLRLARANPWGPPGKGSTIGFRQLGQEGWRDHGESRGWAGPTQNL